MSHILQINLTGRVKMPSAIAGVQGKGDSLQGLMLSWTSSILLKGRCYINIIYIYRFHPIPILFWNKQLWLRKESTVLRIRIGLNPAQWITTSGKSTSLSFRFFIQRKWKGEKSRWGNLMNRDPEVKVTEDPGQRQGKKR